MVTREQLADARRDLGHRLASMREAAGLTQAQLAKLTGYTRSALANVETGRSNQPRTCWVRYDQLLGAAGALLAAYDQYASLTEQRRQQATQERERQRTAKIEQWQRTHTNEEAGQRFALAAIPEQVSDPSPVPDGALVLDSHKFIPTFIGVDAARALFGDVRLDRTHVGWLDCRTTLLRHPDGECRLYLFECGVAVIHLRQRQEPEALTDLALWRYRSYAADLPWVEHRLTDILGPDRTAAGEPEYVLSLYWLHSCAWAEPHLDTALRLICAPSVLVDRRTPSDPQPLDRPVEHSLIADGFTHPDMMPFGVQGVSIGYAAWSGVAYHPLAPERALALAELIDFEIIVQMLWSYSDRIQRTVEDGHDPSVPTTYGWRFLRAAHSRLTAARPQETTQHHLMREAVVNTSGILGKLRAAQEALWESEQSSPEVRR